MEEMSLEDFGEARLLMAADAGWKPNQEEIEIDAKEKAMATRGMINGYTAEFFAAMTVEEFLAKGFSVSSVLDIHNQLTALGLDFVDYGDDVNGYQWYEYDGASYLIKVEAEETPAESAPIDEQVSDEVETGERFPPQGV